MERRLQIASSLAFFVLCVVGTAVGIKALLSPDRAPAPVANARGAGPRPTPVLYAPGEKIQVAGVNFELKERTLLLVMQKGCKFCELSMPFYQDLGKDFSITKRTRIVAIAPDEEGISEAELARFGVRVDQIVRLSISQLKVRGTPTAIVVGPGGVIERVMGGQLDEAEQAQLVGLLKSGS
jgi:hypothetical protein